MKTMKKLFLAISLMALTGTISYANNATDTKSKYLLLSDLNIDQRLIPKNNILYTNTPPKGLESAVKRGDIENDCLYDNCDQRIEENLKYYQGIANEICEAIVFSVTCCSGGYEICALVFVYPNCFD